MLMFVVMEGYKLPQQQKIVKLIINAMDYINMYGDKV